MQFTATIIATIMAASVIAAPSAKWTGCRVIVWKDENFRGASEGFPDYSGCNNLDSELAGQMSSYSVTDCACDFFENFNCNGFRFTADRRSDREMSKNGQDNDRIRSFRCH